MLLVFFLVLSTFVERLNVTRCLYFVFIFIVTNTSVDCATLEEKTSKHCDSCDGVGEVFTEF